MSGKSPIFYKFPKGLKKKLAEHYGFKHPLCVLCWSSRLVAIDHYRTRDGATLEDRNAYEWQMKKMIESKGTIHVLDWSDISKFVLLCASCHSKVERMRDWHNGKTREDRPPMLNLLDDIVQKAKKQSEKKTLENPTI
jgi:hypothetical protein